MCSMAAIKDAWGLAIGSEKSAFDVTRWIPPESLHKRYHGARGRSIGALDSGPRNADAWPIDPFAQEENHA